MVNQTTSDQEKPTINYHTKRPPETMKTNKMSITTIKSIRMSFLHANHYYWKRWKIIFPQKTLVKVIHPGAQTRAELYTNSP